MNSRVRHLINDLLRENITVFWSSTDFQALSQEIETSSTASTQSYAKGTFVIPLSSDQNTTALITALVYNYNQTHELEPDNQLQVPVYYFISPLEFSAYPLVEPRIAQHLGTPTRYGWPCYLLIAEAGGFYTMEFLLDDETSILLNNQDFNVFMWPYDPEPASLSEQLYSLTHKKTCTAVRQFVAEGGGYIGSCYGALAASSGILRPFPIIFLHRAYNPNFPCILPSIGFSLSDSVMSRKPILQDTLYVATSTITDTSYPVTYGINTTVHEFFKGPWFMWLGRNTQQVAHVQDLTTADADMLTDPVLQNKVIGTPSWVHSQFGQGKVVLFSSHPEFINNISFLFEGREWDGDRYYGRRVIHNSLLYVTAQKRTTVTATQAYSLSDIERFGEKTTNLSLEKNPDDSFSELTQRILGLYTNLSCYQQTISELEELSHPIFSTGIWKYRYRYSLYPYNFANIFKQYCQKTVDVLETLNDVIFVLKTRNISSDDQIAVLTHDMSKRLNYSDELVLYVGLLAEGISELLEKRPLSLRQQTMLHEQLREMLQTFEIGLKYIPQLYFESAKTLRHLWYSYETVVAIAE